MKILVSGANGQLGKSIRDVSGTYTDATFYFLGREHFAIDQFAMVDNVLKAIQPDVVINTAAYTAVDKAESESSYARLINAESAGHLAASCKLHGARLIHISTDYVFDGSKKEPYTEEDATNPVNVYGQTKLEGEHLVMQANQQSVIVRASWIYSPHGSNFVKTMVRLMREKASIGVVGDQFGCPTYAADLAHALLGISLFEKSIPGIFHFSNSGPISWHEFALAIKNSIHSTCEVRPLQTSEYPTAARRPANSCLSNKKIDECFGIRQLSWHESLQRCLEKMAG